VLCGRIHTPVTSYLRTVRVFSRDARLYLIVPALLGFTVHNGITAVLLNLYLLRLGYGPRDLGVINSVGPLVLAMFSMPAAALGRKLGPRRPIIWGLGGLVLGEALLPLAEVLPGTLRFGWLLGTLGLANLGLGTVLVNSSPFLMTVTGPAERNHLYSVQSALSPLMGFAGSLVGGFLPGVLASLFTIQLGEPTPFAYALFVSAVLLVPSVVAVVATNESSPRTESPVRLGAGSRPAVLIGMMSLVILAQVASEGGVRHFFNVYLDTSLRVPPARIGFLAAGGQLLAVPAALVAPVLAARWGNGRSYLLASLLMAVSMAALAVVPSWQISGLAYMGVVAMAAIARPCIIVYQMEIVSPRWRPLMSGATTLAFGLSLMVTSLGGGYLIESAGYPAMFLVTACATTAGALLFWARFEMGHGRGRRRGQAHARSAREL
jgi:MFS family permease